MLEQELVRAIRNGKYRNAKEIATDFSTLTTWKYSLTLVLEGAQKLRNPC